MPHRFHIQRRARPQSRISLLGSQGAPWYIRSGISVINRLAGFLPSLIPSLPDIGKKDHLDMRTVFGVWVKGPEGPALLSHLLAHVHNTLIKVRATLEIRLRSSPSRAR